MNKPKVVEISETLFEIPELNHIVKLQTKKGRRIWTCSCQNHARFNNENAWCFDKELVLEYINLKKVRSELDKLINSYEGFSNIKLKLNPRIPLNDLKELRYKLK